jgi:putative ABC transport system substrate-binding protein
MTAPLTPFAQRAAKVPRVGLLISETLSTDTYQDRLDAFHAGLRELGYVDGKNIAIETRAAEGDYDRLPRLATELVREKTDVIIAVGARAISAAVRATTTIPIVVPSMGDPVALGLSSSLARPGKNVTGIVSFPAEAGAKRVEFLKELLPRLTRVGVLVNPPNTPSPTMHATANALKVELELIDVRTSGNLRRSLEAAAERGLEGIIVSTDALFRANLDEIANLVTAHHLPSIGPKEYAVAGGLIGYSADIVGQYHRSAYFVARILQGAKPDDLPIEQVTKLDLVINLKTAKALSIPVPRELLLRADEVIQ